MSQKHPEDVFKILVATDIHLGYEEKHPVRGDDSFNSFEEILQLAHENEVDFILLGGDLFHDTKPSPNCMHRCMSLLRKYCLGDRAISFEFLSEQDKVFEHTSQKVVNYEDPNINVSIPVFSIHGNHDDPTGEAMICSLDILSTAGLVNYFGKSVELDELTVNPLLMQKGETFLSIHGMSYFNDSRLARLFENSKVTFLRADEHLDDWFNMCVLHQNRADRGRKNFIPETALPSFLDLIVWGHEHDCRILPEYNATQNFHVSQPGSSVATSLSEGESIPKKVALLKIHKKEFNLVAIELQTVRPFIFRDIQASDLNSDDDMEHLSVQFEQKAEEEVNSMIQEAQGLLSGHPKQPRKPLIRLRCFYSDEDQMFNAVRFGQKFDDQVANSDILLFRKQFEKLEKRDVLEKDVIKQILLRQEDLKVEDYVKKYFRDIDNQENYRMNVLTVAGLNEAITHMLEKQHNDAVSDIVKYQSSRMEKHLMSKDLDEGNIDDIIRNFNVERSERESEITETREHLQATSSNGVKRNGHSSFAQVDDVEKDEDEDEVEVPVVETGRGRGRGRAPRAARARAARAPRAPRGGSTARGRATQRTMEESFSSQISVVRTSARATANRSRIQFQDSDSD